ncbi:MAG: E3 binding domain-containing protein, partial [Chloroflexi bacterium]|nr:E3 binding domain-containing protein [Chloroflexota bacterium]
MYELLMPKFGLTMEEGKVERWLKREGEEVKKGEPIVEVSSEKITNTVESPVDGIVAKILVKEGETAKVGTPIALIASSKEEYEKVKGELPERPGEKTQPTELPKETIKIEVKEEEINASPLAKRIAKEKGVDLRLVKGTGEGGRITKEDVLRFIE